MKFLNVIDLGFQSLILGAVVLVSIAIAFTGHFETIGMVGLYGAIFLGPWQMVSSIATTIARGHYFRWRVIHLVSSVAYIVIFSAAASLMGNTSDLDALRAVGTVFGFLIPVVLAVFYYFITLKSFQLSRVKNP
jgi:hypothetical protein